MAYDVFISYSSHDTAVASRLRERVEAKGIRCWMAPRDIPLGAVWSAEIMGALRDCRVMLLLLSRSSNKSDYVLREVDQATTNGLWIIPIRIEDDEPRSELKFYLGILHQRIDAFASPFEVWADDVVKSIRSVLAALGPKPAPQSPDGREQALVPHGRQEIEEAWNRLSSAPSVLRTARTLAEGMVSNLSPYVPASSLPDLDGDLQTLESQGLVRSQPSAVRAGDRLLSFGSPLVVQFALSDWIEVALPHTGEFNAAALLRVAEKWPLLSDGLARYLRRRWDGEGRRLFAELLAQEGTVVASTLAALPPMLIEDQRLFEECLEIIPANATVDALNGLSQGAQRLMLRSMPDAAERLYRALIVAVGERRSIADYRNLLDTIDNELGRLLRRTGRLTESVAHFEKLLVRLQNSQDDELSGTVTLNLARGLLDTELGDGPRTRRAIQLVEGRLSRFRKTAHLRNLAVAHHCLGDAYGRFDAIAAEQHYRQDVEASRQCGDPEMLADSLGGLGNHLTQSGEWHAAKAVHQEELSVCETLVDQRRLGLAQAHLARCLREESRHSGDKTVLRRARDHYLDSLRVLLPLNQASDLAPIAEAAGRLSYLLGEQIKGAELLNESIRQFRRWPEGNVIADEIQAELNAVRW